MTFIGLIIAIAIIGLVVYLIKTFIPMDSRFVTVINIIAGIIALIMVLEFLGIHTGFPTGRLY